MQVKFEGFAFNALLLGGVTNGDGGEIGLSCHRTERGEFRGGKGDLVGPAGFGVEEGLQTSQRRIGRNGNFAAQKAESRHGLRIVQNIAVRKDRR